MSYQSSLNRLVASGTIDYISALNIGAFDGDGKNAFNPALKPMPNDVFVSSTRKVLSLKEKLRNLFWGKWNN